MSVALPSLAQPTLGASCAVADSLVHSSFLKNAKHTFTVESIILYRKPGQFRFGLVFRQTAHQLNLLI